MARRAFIVLGRNRRNTTTGTSNTANTQVAYEYTANGDLQSDGLRRYTVDAEGRIVDATTGATDESPTTRYAHNALGQRVFKTEPQYTATPGDEANATYLQSLFRFFSQLWSPTSQAKEKLGYAYSYDEDGTLIAEAGSGGANSAGNARYIYLPTASGPMQIAAVINGKQYAVHSDHLNTPRRLTQSDGKVAWQWSYSGFGEVPPTTAKNRFADLTSNPNPGTTAIPDVAFNLRYPGQYADKESGLFYNYFRTYQPGTGRYVQSDPIGLAGGWNTYGYVGANPLNKYDRFGLSKNDVFFIRSIFELEMNKLNDCKCRLPTTGKLGGITNNVYRFYSGNDKLLECYGQATDLLGGLDKNSKLFDDKWKFEMMTRPGHYLLEGSSSNSKDPVLILDPWINSFDARPAGSPSSGTPAGAIPGSECSCGK